MPRSSSGTGRASAVKIYISVDMEGITGVAARNHVDPGHPEFQRFRRLMTQDVNAAIEGAMEAGATEFVVNDSHASMYNVLIEELHPAARLISGSNKELCQMEAIDSSFAGVFFVGYHAMEGAEKAVINHTLMSRSVTEIRCNGVTIGESAMNAGTAGDYGVPVALVTGDDRVAAEVAATISPDVVSAVVKRGIDRFTAECLPPAASHKLIRESAAEAVRRLPSLKAHRVEGPVRFEVTFKTTSEAAICTLFPTVERVDSKTVAVTGDDYVKAFRQLWGCLILGRSADGGVLK